MRDGIALQRYLQRHIEPGLPGHSFHEPYWHDLLVVPVYRESPDLLQHLTKIPAGKGRNLVILVLNRPETDTDSDANTELRNALTDGSLQHTRRGTASVLSLNGHTDLYLHDMEALCGPLPAKFGVGLARKAGCDLALQWMVAGGISSQWICNTDADATLPQDYFEQLDRTAPEAVAAVFPFQHIPAGEKDCDIATALYELRLHHYVLGLEYAGSPYAYHSLGSCTAVRASAYTHVRGFPKRAGAEDFYILNKLAKLGSVTRLAGGCVELLSRTSSRVPFGTGPAVEAIIENGLAEKSPLFYHPRCFAALRALISSLPELARAPEQDLVPLLVKQRLPIEFALQSNRALQSLGIQSALEHCQRQSNSSAQFRRHFHQWFDALATLKFIHAIRDATSPQQSLFQLDTLHPRLWPTATEPPYDMAQLRAAIKQHWGWQ